VEANPRLNLAFTAILFNTYPSLGPTAEEKARAEAESLKDKLDAEQEAILQLKGDLQNTQGEVFDLSGRIKDLSLELAGSLNDKNDILNSKLELASQLADVQQDSMNLKLELDQSNRKSDDLFAQLEAELDLKLGFETQLQDTQAELESTRNAAAAEKENLEKRLTEETKGTSVSARGCVCVYICVCVCVCVCTSVCVCVCVLLSHILVSSSSSPLPFPISQIGVPRRSGEGVGGHRLDQSRF
jgi:hypothetical protein